MAASSPSSTAPANSGALTTTDGAPAAATSPSTPPGTASTGRASPPPAGSSQTWPSASSLASVGSGRAEAKTSDPSGRNAACDSPRCEYVSRRAGAEPSAGTSQSAVANRVPSGESVWTGMTSRFPSGERCSPVTRGMALKPSSESWSMQACCATPGSVC